MKQTDYAENYGFANAYLSNGEYILWKGKPEKGNLIVPRDIFTLLFGLFWLSFSVFWEYNAVKGGAPIFFALFGLPFIGIGIYMVIGRFLQAAYLRNKTFYVITNKKIIIKRGKKLTMHDGENLPPMQTEIYKNGNGTIFFGDISHTRNGNYNAYFVLENLSNITQVQTAISNMEKE